MQFSLSFVLHFVFSFAGFLLFGISLCRGSWRNVLRNPYILGAALIFVGHLLSIKGPIGLIASVVVIALGAASLVIARRNAKYVPSVERDGHNAFSLIVGAALFGLAVQMHYAVTGVSVFELVK